MFERVTVSLSLASLSVVHDTVQAALTELNIVASQSPLLQAGITEAE